MLTLRAPQAETLWDEVLPIEAKELPEDLGKIDALLGDPELLRPIATHWEEEASETGRAMLSEGRPTIAMETYVRLMVLKQRTGWGYETLVKEVSDSIHLRRFCLIPLHERVPCESTVRKLTRRLGAETVAELTRALIAKAQRERRFRARAARIDSTVVEADVRYPTDSGLAADGVKALAREARKMLSLAGKETKAVRDRSRALGKRLRAMSRTLARRSGERKAEVLRLTGECGELLRRSVGEARRLAAAVKGRARGRGAQAKLSAARRLTELAERCEKVSEQIAKRIAGEPISDRLVSLSDPDARPIRKGKQGNSTEFGYVVQLCELTASTKPGQRGLLRFRGVDVVSEMSSVTRTDRPRLELADSPSPDRIDALAREADRIGFGQTSGGGQTSPSGFRLLKWLAIVLPVVFIAGLNYLLHTALHSYHDFPRLFYMLALLVILTAAFSFVVFGIVERLERRVLERNAMLAALVAVGREAGSSLDLDELLDKSLAAILDITSVDAAEVWLLNEGGDLELAHHRGAAPEAFREKVRLRLGEGLPGLVGEKGLPIVVRDLSAESRFVRPAVQRQGFESFCALPIRHRGETYGVLCVAAIDSEAMQDEAELGLLEGIAERLAAAIESSRLHERVLDAAVLEERERIAHELHDGLAQVLGYINTQTLAVRKLVASNRTNEAVVQLEAMEEAAKRVYADVREGIFNLRTPPVGSDRLSDAVRKHLRNYREMPGVPATLEVIEDGELPRLSPATEIQLMWIVQEALNNVRKHAEADNATVRFSTEDTGLVVSVEDDGRGFMPERRARTGWPHFGLQTMRERAEAVGGDFDIQASPERGTQVRVRVPLPQSNGVAR